MVFIFQILNKRKTHERDKVAQITNRYFANDQDLRIYLKMFYILRKTDDFYVKDSR